MSSLPNNQSIDSLSQQAFCFETEAALPGDMRVWLESPGIAFEAWRRSRLTFHQWTFSERSIVQHRSMFRHYLQFLTHKGVGLFDVDSRTIEEFLMELQGVPDLPSPKSNETGSPKASNVEAPRVPASKITVRRYVQLLGETYSYLVSACGLQKNPMDPILAIYAKPEVSPVVTYLTAGMESAFLNYVKALPTETWREERDAAILWVLFGTGVSLSEVCALRIRDIRLDDYVPVLEVAENAPVPLHLAPVAEFAIEPIQAWFRRRLKETIEGDIFFPATPGGQPLDTSRVYRIVRKALDAIGSVGKHRGPATLRNTFARRQLHQGTDPEQIKAWMGLSTDRTINKLRKTLVEGLVT